jgi:hypothetical protein
VELGNVLISRRGELILRASRGVKKIFLLRITLDYVFPGVEYGPKYAIFWAVAVGNAAHFGPFFRIGGGRGELLTAAPTLLRT